ncbi:hypothetical protein J6R97_05725 [bacterium]|nr:hypothetical protein [bacterium]
MKISTINYSNSVMHKQQKRSQEINKNSTEAYAITLGTIAITGIAIGSFIYSQNKNEFRKKLANDLSKELNEKISPKQLKSVISNKELLKILSNLKEKNYIASTENIKNGTFLADLHSHSHYSDGTIKIIDLLEQAAKYGNKLNKINGKKFTIALSDHDGIEGVKEALKIIAKNPKRYKNINFVPASELSFIMPTAKNSERAKRFNSSVEMPELLIYGINPFSKETINFYDNLYSKRKEQIFKSIEDAKKILPEVNFDIAEYIKFFNPEEKYCFLNQHWKIWNYLHTKTLITNVAKEHNMNIEVLYNEICSTLKKNINPYTVNEYFKNHNISTNIEKLNPDLSTYLQNNIFPKKINETEAKSLYEPSFADLVDFAKKENAILGFAHPGFTMQNFERFKMHTQMEAFIKASDGRLKLIEKYHQAYPIGSAIDSYELEQYNTIIDKLNLIQMGGRDNHKPNLF